MGQEQELLAGLVVVELPGNAAVRYCGRLFAVFGARVVAVGPARLAPDGATRVVAENAFFDAGKERAALDDGDSEAAARLVLGADVVLADAIPPPLRDAGVLDEGGSPRKPSLVLALITDYGFEGPYAGYHGTSLTGHAAGGYLYHNGDPECPPLRGLEYHPYAQAGSAAFVAAMAALFERRRSGLGQRVSTSVMQALAPLHAWTTVRYSHGGIIQKRLGNRYSIGHPNRVYRTRDGYWMLTVVDQKRLDLLLALAGHPAATGDPRFETIPGREAHAAEIDAMIEPWLLAQGDTELTDQFEAIKLPAAPLQNLAQVLADPAFRERDFWRQVRLPGGRTATIPGPPVRLVEQAYSGVARPSSPGPAPRESAGSLAGLRVLDLTAGWSGPLALRLLGDLGADVVRVEPPWGRGVSPPDDAYVQLTGFYPDNDPGQRFWMRSGFYNKFAYNKRNVAMRMDTTEGRRALARLVEWADVVIDNFSTQAWEKLGLTCDWLHSVNPGVIAVTMPGYGRWGPASYRVSYGNQLEAYIGADSLMGYEGADPHMFSTAWPDPCAAMHAAAAALVGAWARASTGAGMSFEVAQTEGALNFIGPDVALYSLTGELPPRRGNRHAEYAPQGVYPCLGDNRWVAISVTSDEAWQQLCRVIALDALARRADLETSEGRRRAHDVIDDAVAAWTARRTAADATRHLQSAGVAAFPVYDARDMLADEYLWAYDTFVRVQGEPLPGFPYQLSRTPPGIHRPVADVGEHNREVLSEAGLTEAEIALLEAAGIIVDRPSL